MKSRFVRKRLPRLRDIEDGNASSQAARQSPSKNPSNEESRDDSNIFAAPSTRYTVRMTGNGVEVALQEPSTLQGMQLGGSYDQEYDWVDEELNPEDNDVFMNFKSTVGRGADSSTRKERRREQNKRQKEKQSHVWLDQVLPRLVDIYMEERARKKGRFRSPLSSQSCHCLSSRSISVLLLRWSSIEEVNIHICCQPAADQLVNRGFFPSAPIFPSIAVDIDLLHFISIASLHMSPNVTAWSEVLEEFWKVEGFEFLPKGSLRKRLSNCLYYYLQLVEMTKAVLSERIDESRHKLRSSSVINPQIHIEPSNGPPNALTSEFPSALDNDGLGYPSDKLIRRCPACFGNGAPNLQYSKAHAIVCLDACFAHKRRRSAKNDPPYQCHDSVFISPAIVDAMEAQVASLRKEGGRTNHNLTPLTNQVLDDCEKSFKAAQESSSKTSNNFYDDTALMALICRHDRVLFVVNMKSTGEKQHYALSLLETLFKELPSHWTVGVLYDIGCQLDRSCRKYGLLEGLSGRIIWGLSVFHAYGHQWPCQLTYHPRKRSDFGLTDGEGCERYWSSLSRLVSPLRVSSHHKRLFTLDLQTRFDSLENLYRLSDWIGRKVLNYKKRRENSTSLLNESGFSLAILEEQWSLQLTTQTKEVPRRQRATVKKLIGSLLLLRSQLREISQKRGRRTRNLADDEEIDGEIEQIKMKIQSLERQIGGSSQNLTLSKAENDKFLHSRLKALAIKQKLLPRLVSRKFEASRLGHGYHKSAFGNKMFVQIKKSLNSREQGLKTLAQSFNHEVENMKQIQIQNKYYKNHAVPRPLDIQNLFNMDPSSSIWDTFGLEDSDDEEPPAWQANEHMRKGIVAKLDLDRCKEEEERLWWEISSVCRWAIAEAQVLADAWVSHAATMLNEVFIHWQKTFSLWPWADNLLSTATDSLKIVPFREYRVFRATEISILNEVGRTEEDHKSELGEDGVYDSEDADEELDDVSDVSELDVSLIRMSESETEDLYM